MSRLGRNFRRQKPKESNNLPSFFAPLKTSLLLEKGQGVATFTRSTIATCWCYLENAVSGDSQSLQVIPSGIPRFAGARFIASNNTWSNLLADGTTIPESALKGVMIETASTNIFLQSETLATQNVTTTATTYTVTFYGTGTVTLSGTATATLVGTGASDRVSLTVTATAGTLTATVTGACTKAQCEAKPMATSYIPTTTLAVARNADILTFPNVGNVSDSSGTVLVEATPAFDIPNGTTAGFGQNYIMDFGVTKGIIDVFSNTLRRFDSTNIVTSPVFAPKKDTTYKIGSIYGSTGQKNILNGLSGVVGTFDGSINSSANMTIGGWGGGQNNAWGGTIKKVRFYKKQLSDFQIDELQKIYLTDESGNYLVDENNIRLWSY